MDLLLALVAFFLTLAGLYAARDPPAPSLAGFKLEIEKDDIAERQLVLVLHKEGSDPEEAFALLNDIPALEHVRIVSVHAPHPAADGSAYWLQADGLCAADHDSQTLRRLRGVGTSLERLVDLLLTRYPTHHRAIVVGVGQGASLAMHLSLAAPQLVREAIAIGGHVLASSLPVGPQPVASRIRQLARAETADHDTNIQTLARARGLDFVTELVPRAPQGAPGELEACWLAHSLTSALENP